MATSEERIWMRNPLTGRPILIGGPTYERLMVQQGDQGPYYAFATEAPVDLDYEEFLVRHEPGKSFAAKAVHGLPLAWTLKPPKRVPNKEQRKPRRKRGPERSRGNFIVSSVLVYDDIKKSAPNHVVQEIKSSFRKDQPRHLDYLAEIIAYLDEDYRRVAKHVKLTVVNPVGKRKVIEWYPNTSLNMEEGLMK